MTRPSAVGLLALALALPFPLSRRPEQETSRLRSRRSVRHGEKAYNAGDAAAVAALYTPDAKLMVPGAEPAPARRPSRSSSRGISPKAASSP